MFVAQGLEDPSKNVATLMQGGLGMPDREYYLAADKDMAGHRDAYRKYIAGILALAGSNERKIADYYAAFMDEAGIDQRGLAPLQAKLDGIDAIADGKALSAWLGG